MVWPLDRGDRTGIQSPGLGVSWDPEGTVPLTTVEPTRLYRQIAEQIAALIDSGEFAAGTRLPAERELASVLGVSRTSVREAIICL